MGAHGHGMRSAAKTGLDASLRNNEAVNIGLILAGLFTAATDGGGAVFALSQHVAAAVFSR
jgi:hypothetical protein